jgi:hypothetical protein
MTVPYDLTLYSFVDAQGVEQEHTSTDPEQARAHAARYRLLLLRNSYEFVSSEPIPAFTGERATIAEG